MSATWPKRSRHQTSEGRWKPSPSAGEYEGGQPSEGSLQRRAAGVFAGGRRARDIAVVRSLRRRSNNCRCMPAGERSRRRPSSQVREQTSRRLSRRRPGRARSSSREHHLAKKEPPPNIRGQREPPSYALPGKRVMEATIKRRRAQRGSAVRQFTAKESGGRLRWSNGRSYRVFSQV